MKINIIKNNLEKYIAYKKLSNQEFERSIGVSNGYIAKLKGSMGKEKLDYMLEVYSDLNRDWLLFGEGEMLKKQDAPISVSNINGDNIGCGHDNTINNSDVAIHALIEQIKVKDLQINKSQDQISIQQEQITKSQEQISKSQEQIDRLISLLEKK